MSKGEDFKGLWNEGKSSEMGKSGSLSTIHLTMFNKPMAY
jgi:hypothetical protein